LRRRNFSDCVWVNDIDYHAIIVERTKAARSVGFSQSV
jgi:hypothetical protein